MPGRLWWGTEGFHTEIGFPHYLAPVAMSSLRLETANIAVYPLAPRTSFICGYFVSISIAAFTSTIAINAEQLAISPHLEPAFEQLLRNSNVHESIISTLRINAVSDRDTFVHMFDSEAALKDGASDLGFDSTGGGLPHQWEFARVVTSWKTAKIMAETADRCCGKSSWIASNVASM